MYAGQLVRLAKLVHRESKGAGVMGRFGGQFQGLLLLPGF